MCTRGLHYREHKQVRLQALTLIDDLVLQRITGLSMTSTGTEDYYLVEYKLQSHVCGSYDAKLLSSFNYSMRLNTANMNLTREMEVISYWHGIVMYNVINM